MKNEFKTFLKVLSVTIFTCTLIMAIGGLYIGGILDPPLNETEILAIFEKDFTTLEKVLMYLQEDMGDMEDDMRISIEGENYLLINDENIFEHLRVLRNKGYKSVSREGNVFIFLRRSNLDVGQGFVYATSKARIELELQFLTKLVELNHANWYYYEEDFNKWRKGADGI